MQADIQAVEAVAAWLEELGLGNGSDRLHKYICEIRKQRPLPTNIEAVAEMGFVYLEAREFVDVHAAYKGSEDSNLVTKLERALSGCRTLAEESSQNNGPRNTMFELALAAGLRLRGVEVELGEPDLIINFPNGQYVVECKRPFRETSVRANVKDAESQLRENVKPGQYGVIAISLTRIINPGTRVLSAVVGERDKTGTIHGTLQADLHRKSSRLMRTLATLSFSPDIAALMFDISTPCLTEKGEDIAHGSRFYPTDEPKLIMGTLRRPKTHSAAFTYLDNMVGEVLNSKFSPEAQSEIDRMNYLAQMSIGLVTSKQ